LDVCRTFQPYSWDLILRPHLLLIFPYIDAMKILSILFFFLFWSFNSFSQADSTLFSRLQAIHSNKIDFYKVDGFEISSEKFELEFNKDNIKKVAKKLGVKGADLSQTDPALKFSNVYFKDSEEKVKGVVLHSSCYLIEGLDRKLIRISFWVANKSDKDFERDFAGLVRNNAIPKEVFNSMEIDSINFGGRKIAVPGICRNMGVNDVQCPSSGQMSWNVHKSLTDASSTLDDQLTVIRLQKGGKVLSDTVVNVVFEGKEVAAKKLVYGFKGMNSLLLKMEGAKTLTVYGVAAPVRGNFVSCLMSFWDMDFVGKTGLPVLLEKVMVLK